MASVFIALLVLIGLFVAALAVPIINQTNHLQEAAPGYVDKLKKDPTVNDLNERYQLVSKASAAAGKLPERSSALPTSWSRASPRRSPRSSSPCF